MVRSPKNNNLKYLTQDIILEAIKEGGGKISAERYFEIFEKELSLIYGRPVSTHDLLRPALEGKQIDALRDEVDDIVNGRSKWGDIGYGLMDTVDLVWVHLDS